jgi:hypothetical protein
MLLIWRLKLKFSAWCYLTSCTASEMTGIITSGGNLMIILSLVLLHIEWSVVGYVQDLRFSVYLETKNTYFHYASVFIGHLVYVLFLIIVTAAKKTKHCFTKQSNVKTGNRCWKILNIFYFNRTLLSFYEMDQCNCILIYNIILSWKTFDCCYYSNIHLQ